MVNKGKADEVLCGLKNKVLKDTDFKELGIKLPVSKKDYETLTSNIRDDMIFLCRRNITDYSILINIHNFSPEDWAKVSNNYRVVRSTDGSQIYTFSIIDFITVN